ncbi:MAG: DUF5696 domain-containing protein [Bacillota bacterium]|nr:DUF5696 domain-containing protein [Bacillota bacterium]
MKRSLFALSCLMILLMLVSPALASDAVLQIEKDGAKLQLDPSNMLISFTPPGSDTAYEAWVKQSDSGSRAMQNLQKSLLSVQYITNARTGTSLSMDSYSMCVDLGEAKYEELENGFRIRLSIGPNELVIDDLPKAIPVSTYNERLRPHWSERNDKLFKSNYRVVPREEGESMFVRVKDDLGRLAISQLYKLFFETGEYTLEDRDKDNEAYGYVVEYVNPKIILAMDFQIDQGDLLVSVPLSELSNTKDNDVVSLDLLPYFLSETQGKKGYLFVPDGSGALINFDNQRLGIAAYSAPVYGEDLLIRADEYRPSSSSSISLPVYGIKTEEGAAMCIIEEGAELANITAAVSGHSDEFNRIYSTFTLRDIERVAMGGNKTVTTPRYAEDVYQGTLKLRYKFMPGADKGYADMAFAYKNYLKDQGVLKAQENWAEHAPLQIELIGAVQKQKFFLGIPYQSTVTATSIEQANSIYDKIKQSGAQNVQLLYSGLFRQGVKHANLNPARLENGIGSATQLKELSQKMKAAGDSLYPVAYLGRVYSVRGFSTFSNAARLHDGSVARVFEPFEPQLRGVSVKNSAYISPAYLPEYAQGVQNSLSEYGASGLAVHDLGNTLVGTYKRRGHISPIHSVPYYQQSLDTLAKNPLMLDTPNAYALPYASSVSNLPTQSSDYKLFNFSVPFLQLVYDGMLPYAGTSWNLRPQQLPQLLLLEAIESRTAPRFTLTYEEPTIFHDTGDLDFTGYFATWYQDSLPHVLEAWKAYDDFYQQVKGARITGHEILGDTVRATHYDNGKTVLVNYGERRKSALGASIPGFSYVIQGGENP